MTLQFSLDQEISCVAPDNQAALCVKCSKHNSNVPILDLFPRMRYLINLAEPQDPFRPSIQLLFELGLYLAPVRDPQTGKIVKVVIMNLSDKLVQVSSGMNICDEKDDSLLFSSSPSQSSRSDTETSAMKMSASDGLSGNLQYP